MARLAGKVAIVTGGSLGIGAATCEMMARQGAAVAVTDVLDGAGEATAKRILSAGGTARFWHLDVSSEAEVESVFNDVAGAFGKLDVVVNNAGIAGANKPTDEITVEEWDRVISINARGVFFCTKHAIPHLRRAGGGSIINLSSIYGIIGAPDLPAYHASKGAVRLMTKTDALFYAKDKIRVNSVHPATSGRPWWRNSAAIPRKASRLSAASSTASIQLATLVNRTTLPMASSTSPRMKRSL